MDLFVTIENSEMTDTGLWPGDTALDKYCRRPVYPTDCSTVLVSFPFFHSPLLLFSQIIHYYYYYYHHREF